MSKEDKNSVAFVAYEDHEPLDPSVPEKDLLRAILTTALSDVKKGGDDKRRATEFFLSPEDDYVFSFLAICDYLKIDHKRVLVVAGVTNSEDYVSSTPVNEVTDNVLFSDENLD